MQASDWFTSELHPTATSQSLDLSSLARVLPTAEAASVSALEAVVAQLAPAPSPGAPAPAPSASAPPLVHYACAVAAEALLLLPLGGGKHGRRVRVPRGGSAARGGGL